MTEQLLSHNFPRVKFLASEIDVYANYSIMITNKFTQERGKSLSTGKTQFQTENASLVFLEPLKVLTFINPERTETQ